MRAAIDRRLARLEEGNEQQPRFRCEETPEGLYFFVGDKVKVFLPQKEKVKGIDGIEASSNPG